MPLDQDILDLYTYLGSNLEDIREDCPVELCINLHTSWVGIELHFCDELIEYAIEKSCKEKYEWLLFNMDWPRNCSIDVKSKKRLLKTCIVWIMNEVSGHENNKNGDKKH